MNDERARYGGVHLLTRNRVIYAAAAAGIVVIAFLGGLWLPAHTYYYRGDTLPPNELALARLLAERYAAEHPCPEVGPESHRCDPDPTPVRSAKSVPGRFALLFAGVVTAGFLTAFGTRSRRARSRNRGGCIGAVVGSVALTIVCFGGATGEGALGCIVSPLIGAALGAFVGAFLGWAAGKRASPSLEQNREQTSTNGPSKSL